MPTAEQAIKAVILCQYLSNVLQPIELFRYNQKEKYIYIIAGSAGSIEIIIYRDGNWEFLIDD
jgi:hypothetical protein